ncbi:hypothetical protein BSPWISOXPB_1370 [uncultured Gammaproteobacteria bacterium]|nr:hypothetical protein BSPWISOXPB_1370 [uncultured Gammaproteobacteria bacterium]
MVPIPMRSENKIQNNPSNLIKMLDSGTKLEILATKMVGLKLDLKHHWLDDFTLFNFQYTCENSVRSASA